MNPFLTCLIALSFALLPCSRADTLFPDKPGRSAPGGATIGQPLELRITGVHGKQIDLANLRGKVVLIDFWATWCPYCVAAVPNLLDAYQKYHDRGFTIIGISMDSDRDALLKFTRQHNMTWPQYFDGGTSFKDNTIAKRFGVGLIPCMWLVDRNGNLVTFNARDKLQLKI